MKTILPLVATLLLGVVLVTGCNGGTGTPEGENVTGAAGRGPADTPPIMAQPVAYRNEEGQLLCPVMNVPIASEREAVGHHDHEGVRYYFCCDGCPERFKADPEAYIKR
jgi:YHS domain-containing protein/predicted small secreted protein